VSGQYSVNFLVGAHFDANIHTTELCWIKAHFITLRPAVEAFDHALVNLQRRGGRILKSGMSLRRARSV
jgi:hypothetical protein